MPLSLEQAAERAHALHEAGERGFRQDGRVLGTVALITQDAVAGVAAFGPTGAPPSDRFLADHVRQTGALALAMTGEYWLDPTPLPPRAAQNLGSDDLPRPSQAPADRRQEYIITTVVVRGYDEVVRILTPIVRSAFGTSLGRRTETRDRGPLRDGEARRLATILATAQPTVR